jgi:integrase
VGPQQATAAATKPTRLRSISERTISQFLAGMRQKPTWDRIGMAPSTIRVALQFLCTALRWGTDQKLLPQCPRFPTVKVPRKKPQPIPAESFERLLAKAPDDNMRVFLLTGWLSGLRLSEALELERTHVAKAPTSTWRVTASSCQPSSSRPWRTSGSPWTPP